MRLRTSPKSDTRARVKQDFGVCVREITCVPLPPSSDRSPYRPTGTVVKKKLTAHRKMKRERTFAALIGKNFCFIIIIFVTVAGAVEETVEIETDEEEELPSLTEILGDGAPLVANTRTAISGALAYGILGRHCANEGKCVVCVR